MKKEILFLGLLGSFGLTYFVGAHAVTGEYNPRNLMRNLTLGDEIYQNEFRRFLRNADTNKDGLMYDEFAAAFKRTGVKVSMSLDMNEKYLDPSIVMKFPRPTFEQLKKANESYEVERR